MTELRFQRRWAHIWWLTLIMATQYAALAYSWLGALHDSQRWPVGSGLRIVIPLLAIAGYWLIACAANSRVSIVHPTGVAIRLVPFPIGIDRNIPRPEIAATCVWNHVETTDEGLKIYNDYSVGLETNAGQHFDIEIHFKTEADATVVAHKVAATLGTQVRTIPHVYTAPNAKRITLLWTALTLLALALGLAWDKTLIIF